MNVPAPARGSGQRAGRALAVLAVLVAASMLLAALIAPALSLALGATSVAFPQLVLRCLQVVSLLLTLVALRALVPRWWQSMGLGFDAARLRRLLRGFALGVLSVSILALVLFVAEVRVVRYDLVVEPSYWLSVVASALISALAISILEEVWFRGALFALLRHVGGAVAAVVLTSLLYAASHFLVRVEMAGDADVAAALDVLLASGARLLDVDNLDSLLALAIGGAWLAITRLRDGDIMSCIGIHAGWVLVIKVFKKYTYIEPGSEFRWMAGSYDDMIGWAASALFVVFALLALRALARRGVR